jgi:outer membrane protein TolC
MQYKVFNTLLVSSLFAITLNANENIKKGDSYLSPTKNDILKYSYDKATQDSQKLKKDWINPVTYKYMYNKGENYTTQKSFISISQPIFKSGGIRYAIKYAASMEKYSNTSIDAQKKELIKQTVNLLFQIKKIDMTINKQELMIKNAKLDIQRKKEQVLNGILDTSFLDNSILDSNVKKNALIDLQYQKDSLINQLANLSDKKYEELKLPVLKLIENDQFLDKNIYIKQAQEDIDSSYWKKNMIKSNYLPTVNFTADYTKYHDIDNNPALSTDSTTNIGFNISIPLDIKYSNTIQSSKIEYLQKKSQLEDKKQAEITIFKNSLAKLKSLDKKIEIAKSDVSLYESLLTQIIEQRDVGMKTDSDVQTMQNSKNIKAYDIKTLAIDKQIELLEIYSRIKND